MLDQDENFYPTSMSILITFSPDNICYRENLQVNHYWQLKGTAKISRVKSVDLFWRLNQLSFFFLVA